MAKLQKFSTQVDKDILKKVRKISAQEGRQLQGLINEALQDLVDKKNKSTPRAHVMAEFETSLDSFDELYKKLAK